MNKQFKTEEMKHTPGPWTYEGGDNSSCEINIGKTTAGLCRWDKNTGEFVIQRSEMEANAKLIAAAPDLLEAIEHYMGLCKQDEEAYEILHSSEGGTDYRVTKQDWKNNYEKCLAAIAKATTNSNP